MGQLLYRPKGSPGRLGFCQRSWGLSMAFAACLILCFGSGAEAITCTMCKAKMDKVCRLGKKTCEETRDNAVCLVRKKYKDDVLTQTLMKCAVDTTMCGSEVTFPMYELHIETNCCSERDFCSDDLSYY